MSLCGSSSGSYHWLRRLSSETELGWTAELAVSKTWCICPNLNRGQVGTGEDQPKLHEMLAKLPEAVLAATLMIISLPFGCHNSPREPFLLNQSLGSHHGRERLEKERKNRSRKANLKSDRVNWGVGRLEESVKAGHGPNAFPNNDNNNIHSIP